MNKFACGRGTKGSWEPDQEFDKIIFERCAHVIARFLKSNGLAEIMKALIQALKQKIGENKRIKRFDFWKVAIGGGKKPTLTIWGEANNIFILFYF